MAQFFISKAYQVSIDIVFLNEAINSTTEAIIDKRKLQERFVTNKFSLGIPGFIVVILQGFSKAERLENASLRSSAIRDKNFKQLP